MRPLDIEADAAELTHRLVTTQQLGELGYTLRQVRYRVAAGLLHPVLNGVYCLDPGPQPFLTKAIAVCLRYPDGFISGAASSHYWELRRGIPGLYEFTVPEGGSRPKGVPFALVRYSTRIEEHHVWNQIDGLRVSSPARAVFEAAGRLDEFALRSMIQSGLKRRQFTADELERVGEELCAPGRRGSRLFRRVVSAIPDEPPVESEEELLLLDALRSAQLADVVPQYAFRMPNGATIHFDIAVPPARLDLEVDGPEHDTSLAVHQDKSRDLQVSAGGWHPMRIPTKVIRTRLRVVTSIILKTARDRMRLLEPR